MKTVLYTRLTKKDCTKAILFLKSDIQFASVNPRGLCAAEKICYATTKNFSRNSREMM